MNKAMSFLVGVPVETPFATDSFTEEIRVSAGGNSVDLVVRAHHARDFAFHHAHPERHVERVFNVLLAHLLRSIGTELSEFCTKMRIYAV